MLKKSNGIFFRTEFFFCLRFGHFPLLFVYDKADWQCIHPAGIYLLKVNNRNRTRCEICSKLAIKTPERHQASVFIVIFEHISHLVLVFLLTLNMQLPAGQCQIAAEIFSMSFLNVTVVSFRQQCVFWTFV